MVHGGWSTANLLVLFVSILTQTRLVISVLSFYYFLDNIYMVWHGYHIVLSIDDDHGYCFARMTRRTPGIKEFMCYGRLGLFSVTNNPLRSNMGNGIDGDQK